MPRERLNDNLIEALEPEDKDKFIYDSVYEKLLLRLYTSGTKTWFYQYHLNGKTKRYRIGKFPIIDTDKARVKASDLKQKVEVERIDIKAKRERENRRNESITLKDWIQKYKEQKYNSLSEASITGYNQVLDRYISDIHDIYLRDLTLEDVTQITDKYNRDGKVTSANRILNILSGVLTFAVKRNKIDENFVIGFRYGKTKKDKEDEDKHDWYSFDQLFQIWEITNEFTQPLKSYFKILMLTGQRKTETLMMEWDNIITGEDHKELQDYPNKAFWMIPAERAKNDNTHFVPLSVHTLKVLDRIKDKTGNSPFVFQSNVKPTQPISETSHHADRIRENTDVKDYNNHTLRHSVGTHLGRLGTSLEVIGRILNQSGISGKNSVTSRYVHHDYTQLKIKHLFQYNDVLIQELQQRKYKAEKKKLEEMGKHDLAPMADNNQIMGNFSSVNLDVIPNQKDDDSDTQRSLKERFSFL